MFQTQSENSTYQMMLLINSTLLAKLNFTRPEKFLSVENQMTQNFMKKTNLMLVKKNFTQSLPDANHYSRCCCFFE